MDFHYRATLITLISIAVLGLIAIPFGNPKFIDRAIILELSFVTLSALIWKGSNKTLYACIPLAVLVIIGNSFAPPHVDLMMTFSKPLNAIVLILGGYVPEISYSSPQLPQITKTSLKTVKAITNF